MGVDIRKLPLHTGIFGAEPWTDAMRRDIEARLGIKAVDIYGLSEIIGPGVACECHRMQNGLHGWEDHFLFEVIDPDTMQPKPMGEAGELVITTLTKEALPMIRYRTRDITRLTDEPCACGRSHVRILRVTGRNDDMMIIRGVNVYPSQVEAVLVGFAGHRAALPDRADARRRARCDDGRGGARAGFHRRPRPQGAGGYSPHQVADRGDLHGRAQGGRRGAALAR